MNSIDTEYIRAHPRSREMAVEQAGLLPDGVAHDCRFVVPFPIFIDHAEGARKWDVDGNEYVCMAMGHGSLILGHAHPDVQRAITAAAGNGCGFGLSTEVEWQLAELIRQAFPSIELLRMVNSGTEAVMSAIRLARGYTGRTKVVMFEGCYHGHSDALLAKAGSGLNTFSLPPSHGVPPPVTAETLVGRYNDLESVEKLSRTYGEQIAGILVEPVAGNMGVVGPAEGFLAGLRALCDRIGALLIFDEVITGFRIAWGGAQERFGLSADLTILGKIIGGGLPVGAFGGRREIMENLTPLGDVYQAGTLAGNPVVLSAGKTVLETLRDQNPYPQIERYAGELTEAILQAGRAASIPLQIGRVAGMFTLFFSDRPALDYVSAMTADAGRYGRFFRAMLQRGVLLPPSQWEASFLSIAHLQEDLLETTVARAKEALEALGADTDKVR